MREVVVTEHVRCDFCHEKSTEMHPVTTDIPFAWKGQDRLLDLCDQDRKEVEHMFETLMEKSRRPDRATAKTSRTRKAPYSGDTRFNAWYDQETQRFVCPGKHDDGAPCQRSFTTANGLAVHHKRQHGSSL